MPRVISPTGKTVEIPSDLYEDFFDEIFIEEKTLSEVLADYKPDIRAGVETYIVNRLAEVDPGYLPGRS